MPACVSSSEIAGWTVARRAAQLVVLPVVNFQVNALLPIVRDGVGGLLFLGPAAPPTDLRAQLAAVEGAEDPGAHGLLVMADVEGGGIQRLPGVVQSFPWPRDMAATMSTRQVQSLAQSVGAQMRSAGVNVDLAPVVDLDDRPGPSDTNPDGARSFGIDPVKTSSYGVAFVRGLQQGGVLPVVKHFPGLGGATANTDDGPANTLPYAQLQTAGLRPFRAAIAAGAPAIMVANASVPGLTDEPASLSPTVINDLLRTQLGFSGLVVTDSLSAGAISAAGDTVPQAAAASIAAGADVVLFGSTLTPADTALLSPANVAGTLQSIEDAIAQAVAASALPESRLDTAVAHVLAAKGARSC